MGESNRVPHVLYRHIGRSRQRVAIPLHRLPEWRRRLPHSLHHRTFTHRKTHVLLGVRLRTIQLKELSHCLVTVTSYERCVQLIPNCILVGSFFTSCALKY